MVGFSSIKIDLTEINNNSSLFSYTSTQQLIIGPNVRTIGTGAFAGIQAQSLLINEGVRTIGNNAFAGVSTIQGRLVIPNSVTSIGDQAFAGCRRI